MSCCEAEHSDNEIGFMTKGLVLATFKFRNPRMPLLLVKPQFRFELIVLRAVLKVHQTCIILIALPKNILSPKDC